ncbi:MAG: cobyric acid synthase CobQ, partial [Candidatus Binatia bacterium]|nr:cobyric acid synthase CobQ [Candidatus Binatia bacterium]
TLASSLDVLVLPGSKSSVADLRWLRQAGWEDVLIRHVRKGGWVIGICGGYQMLGQWIFDPQRIESNTAETVGLGLLDVTTHFARDKITAHVKGRELGSGLPIAGYEIHAGRIQQQTSTQSLFCLTERNGHPIDELEGAQSHNGRVWGTTIHGVFDNGLFRRSVLDRIRRAKGLPPLEGVSSPDAAIQRRQAYDHFADELIAHADFPRIATIAGVVYPPR